MNRHAIFFTREALRMSRSQNMHLVPEALKTHTCFPRDAPRTAEDCGRKVIGELEDAHRIIVSVRVVPHLRDVSRTHGFLASTHHPIVCRATAGLFEIESRQIAYLFRRIERGHRIHIAHFLSYGFHVLMR